MLIIKQTNSIQLSRLYRILYCKSIDDFFRSHNVFLYLDYSLNASSVQGGITLIEITFYTKTAAKFADELHLLPIDFSSESIGSGVGQIISQIKKPLSAPGTNAVKQALEELHQQPWLNIDDLTSINAKEFQLDTTILTLGQGKSNNRRLTVSLKLDPGISETRPDLLPLFIQLTNLINWNCLGMISFVFGFYGKSAEEPDDKNGFSLPLVFYVPPTGQELMDDRERLNKILWSFVNTIHFFQRKGIVGKFMTELRNDSYNKVPNHMPNPDITLADTSIFMGTQGWRKIATVENCELLLKNTVVTVKYGRKHISQPITAHVKNTSK